MAKYPWSLSGEPPSPTIHTHHKTWQFFERHLPNFSIGAMVFMLIAAVLYPHMVITVPSGHVGVLWKRFSGPGIYCFCILKRGTVLDPRELRDEGLHLIWPWDKLFIYDLRLQSSTQTYDAISSEGVRVTATMNIRFQLKHDAVALLHKFIGPGYMGSIVTPEIGSRAREIIGRFTAEDVYSTKRSAIENMILEATRRQLSDHLANLVQPEASEQSDRDNKTFKDQLKEGIQFIDTLIQSIKLPPTVVGAINRKTEQFYAVQEYQFRVERERKESERKQIEASGIAAFQKTVGEGISDSYLRWRGIEATLELAKSNNTKIVIVGGGKDGLPIILGNVDAPVPPPKTETTKPPTTGTTPPTDSTSPTTPPTGMPPDNKPAPNTPTPNTPSPNTPSPNAPAPAPGNKPTGSAPTGQKPVTDSKGSNKDKGSSSLFSLNFSDVGSFFSRFSHVFGSDSGTTGSSPNGKGG